MTNPQYGVPEIPKGLYNEKDTSILPGEDIVAYVSNKVEYVPFQGILVHIQDATFPKKGFPMPESVAAINIIKSIIKESLRFPILILFANKTKLLTSFNNIFKKTFSPYTLKEEYLCPAAYNFHNFLTSFMYSSNLTPTLGLAKEFAYNISHILEYDDAYRYRFQDIISEASLRNLQTNPRKEIMRLLSILKEREGKDNPTARKIEIALTPVLLLLLIPKYKRTFQKAAPSLILCQYDLADRYWAYLKADLYRFGGMDYDERTKNLQIPQAVKVS